MPEQHSIASLLASHTELPGLEVRMLMMHVIQKTRVQLITQADYELTSEQLIRFQNYLQRRLQGEPIAYLIGQREFFGLNFQVTPDVLIPRPDTELLVELGLKTAPVNSNLLDLGTGSGAIAVAIASQRPDLTVWACDISAAALDVAQQNAATHHCQIHFVQSDWFSHLPAQQWQTIISNPPYIVKDDVHLTEGDLRFEPLNALTDHADGLSAYRHIISQAITRLSPGGWLLLEHGYNQATAVRALLAEHRFTQVQSWQDIAGIERVSGAKWAA